MKRKSWLLILVVTVFTLLAMTVSLWIAHTRVISNAIVSLGDGMNSYSMALKHGDITFSKRSVLDIEAVIKDVTVTSGSNEKITNSYHVNEIRINSNLWTRKLLLELEGDMKAQSKLANQTVDGVYKFTHNPIVKIDFRNPFSRSWNSMGMLQQIKLEDVGYQYMNENDGKLQPVIVLESMNAVLDNRGEGDALDWDLKFNLVNHEYLGSEGLKMDKIMLDFYNLVTSSGKNNLYLAMNVSRKDGMKIADKADDEIIDLKIEEFNLSSQIYKIGIKGEVEKKVVMFMPYFDVEVSIDGLEEMLSYYANALNISLEALRGMIPGFEVNAIKNSDVIAAARVLREVSNSSDKGKMAIKILRDTKDFKVADISLPILIQRIQEACAEAGGKGIAAAKKSKKK